ncbi:hypothetical protein [Brevibacillus borstelensis]|uniref:hypothetical protein n=1 Tax=Brevibacillus borstelensis TaxID=45462 RepID=UPI0030C03179
MADDFDQQYARFSRRIEKAMILLIFICAFLVLSGELLLSFDPVRAFLLETERLEGVSHIP